MKTAAVGREVTLADILSAREKRAEIQLLLVAEHKAPLVSFTVNMPGPMKLTRESMIIFHEGLNVLVQTLSERRVATVYKEACLRETGPEAFISVDCTPHILKDMLVTVENTHMLGRLFDFDVISPEGEPLSRSALGYEERKCLLCNQTAHVCTRSRRHPMKTVLRRIHALVDMFCQRKA
ncbi:MAG TPA: citrate lyase holo-[acyl-carrier protein] synthase [Dissulfurispiraceae bacterium]|nr:citrate lyase holo-[acyl-carrier protein] synthase [Dissulfurispiraceae bacterium]